MPEAFQGDVLEIAEALGGKGIVQQRKLFVHDLIEKRVGLRRNADGNAVAQGRHGGRKQIRHGFTDARPRFDHEVRRGRKRPEDLGCHDLLFHAGLITRVHLPYHAARIEHGVEILLARQLQRTVGG